MARKRLDPKSKGLPARWLYKNGAYYYRVPAGQEAAWDNKKWFRLGATLSEAYLEYSQRIKVNKDVRNIGQLLDRYSVEVVPHKAQVTQKNNIRESESLRKAFSDVIVTEIIPMDIYKYVDSRKGKVQAKREIALLSHAFTKAVEWGYIHKHPFKGEVRIENSAPRTRYVEDWEILECFTLESERKKGSILLIQAYIELKLLLGLRLSDMLQIKEEHIKDDGIHVTTGKTGKAVIYTWTPFLRKAVDKCRKARPVDICAYLFCNKHGKCYVSSSGELSGWHSMWQRFMERMLKETKVTERFTEHDLRAKVASDATSLEHAQQLLTHADSKTTNRIYRRKVELVTPAR